MTKAMAAGSLLYAIGYGIVGLTPYIGMGLPNWLFSPGFLYLAMCMFIVTMGEMVVSPSSMTLVAKMSPDRNGDDTRACTGWSATSAFRPDRSSAVCCSTPSPGIRYSCGRYRLLRTDGRPGLPGVGRHIPEKTDRIDEDG